MIAVNKNSLVHLMFVVFFASSSITSATFTVTNTADSGIGSLRQAIVDANANIVGNTCVPSEPFNSPGGFIFLVPGSTTVENVAGAVANIAAARTAIGAPGPGATPTDSMLFWDKQANTLPAQKIYPSLLREFAIEADPVVNANNYSSGMFGQFAVDADANANSIPGETIMVTFSMYASDRAQLRIVGEDFLSTSNATLENISGDDAMTFDALTGNSNAHATIMLTEGVTYDFEAWHYEDTGTSGIEFYYSLGDMRLAVSRSVAFPLVDNTFRCAVPISLNIDVIEFNIPGAGVQTISLLGSLPGITDAVVINGLSQPLSSPSNILIRLDGSGAGGGVHGLDFTNNSGASEIHGLILNNFSLNGLRIGGSFSGNFLVSNNIIGVDSAGVINANGTNGIDLIGDGGGTIEDTVISSNTIVGIAIPGARKLIIRRNKIGLDPTGLLTRGNGFDGIQVRTDNNEIYENVISANGRYGIWALVIAVGNNSYHDNFIGTDVTGNCTLIAGMCPFGNTQDGMEIVNTNNTIMNNVISGNKLHGIDLFAGSNTITGNIIGADPTGTIANGNTFHGISVQAANNTIGGSGVGEGNTVAFNHSAGISVTFGASVGNTILGNAIFSNDALGIDLNNDGITTNDALDGDTGPNNLQNFPVVTMQISDTNPAFFKATGTLNSLPLTSFLIQVFTNTSADPSGFGEGQHFGGEVIVMTDGAGNANFVIDNIPPLGDIATSTATRMAAGLPVETSEFSAVFIADDDNDGIPNLDDNCPLVPNEDQSDVDEDDVGDVCDNCEFKSNPDQIDTDLDGMGNACDTCASDPMDPSSEGDTDSDGVCDAADRCPGSPDYLDADDDGHPDGCDNCPATANNNQLDADHDGLGDLCDSCTDTDGDNFGDPGSSDFSTCTTLVADNCPFKANLDQMDTDADGMGNACDTCASDPLDPSSEDDADADGVCNAADRCPLGPDYLDMDSDGVPDSCDNCVMDANTLQQDTDHDDIGDACDTCTDIDGDTFGDPGSGDFSSCASLVPDNCEFKGNVDQTDTDGDGMGNACDTCASNPLDPASEDDDDSDGVCNAADRCPDGPDYLDEDADGIPNDCDNCAAFANVNQQDTDHDGTGDACDGCTDVDGDGVGDANFMNSTCPVSNGPDNCTFKLNPGNPQADVDSDGMGDACDSCPNGPNGNDVDGDGIPDACDFCPNDPSNTCTDVLADADFDGVPDGWDNCVDVVNADQADLDGDGEGDVCDTCTDSDGDGFGNPGFANFECEDDNCPFIENEDQDDLDDDGLGDRCDTIPAGAAPVPGPPLPSPGFGGFGDENSFGGGPGGFAGDQAPSPDSAVPSDISSVESAPPPEVTVTTHRPTKSDVPSRHDNFASDEEKEAGSCSTTNPIDASIMALFLMALWLWRTWALRVDLSK